MASTKSYSAVAFADRSALFRLHMRSAEPLSRKKMLTLQDRHCAFFGGLTASTRSEAERTTEKVRDALFPSWRPIFLVAGSVKLAETAKTLGGNTKNLAEKIENLAGKLGNLANSPAT